MRRIQLRIICPYRVIIMEANKPGSRHRVSSSSAVPQPPTSEGTKGEHEDEYLKEINILQTEAAAGRDIVANFFRALQPI